MCATNGKGRKSTHDSHGKQYKQQQQRGVSHRRALFLSLSLFLSFSLSLFLSHSLSFGAQRSSHTRYSYSYSYIEIRQCPWGGCKLAWCILIRCDRAHGCLRENKGAENIEPAESRSSSCKLIRSSCCGVRALYTQSSGGRRSGDGDCEGGIV